MIVNFHELGCSEKLKFSVIVATDQDGFVYVRHQDRSTWEIPGGHIEAGETALEAANRELIEETGAKDFNIIEICNYSVTLGDSTTYGGLFFAEIHSYQGSLDFEIAEVKSFKNSPSDLTYPKIQPLLFDKVLNRLKDIRT
jgi:8-oxo-dGTP diphosphatase